MGWSSLSFPFGSLLTAVKMTQVYSNFASALAQESGAPPPSGVWSFQGQVSVASDFFAPGSSSFGHVSVSSGVSAPGVSSFDAINVGSLTGPGYQGLTAGQNSGGSFFASSGFAGQGVNSFDLVRASGAYTSVSSGVADSTTVITAVGSTETVVSSISFPTNGNRVLLRGYVYGFESIGFATTRFRIRANSLGGAILETGMIQEANAGNSRFGSTLIVSDLPNSSGAKCYVLTAQVIGLSNSFQVMENRLMAIETHLRI
jgi:hypothetical protein